MNLINRAQVRRLLLETAKQTRAHKFERVSTQTLDDINNEVRRVCSRTVQQLPSKGKTI